MLARSARPRLTLVALVALTACGGDAVTEGTPESDTFSDNVLECDAPATCPTLSYQSYAPPNPPSLPSDEAYACALSALRDRTPTLLVVSDGCEGMCSGSVYLVRSDGTALRQPWNESFDEGAELAGLKVAFSAWSERGERCALRPPAFYDTCDTSPDGDCTSASTWFEGCVTGVDARCDR